jgi:hypothetical protein
MRTVARNVFAQGWAGCRRLRHQRSQPEEGMGVTDDMKKDFE